jgi:hypothetical protein
LLVLLNRYKKSKVNVCLPVNHYRQANVLIASGLLNGEMR